MAKRMEQLKKMKMPAKPMAEKEAELDIGLELEPMVGEAEMPEMPEMPENEEMGEMEPGDDMMADIEDDMLIAEMKKRGLTLPEDKEEEEEDMDADEELV